MPENKQHFFVALDTDLICQNKVGGLYIAPHAPLHCHDGYELLVFLEGDTAYYTENQGKQLQRGDIICCAPYTFHCAEPRIADNYARILINITTPYLQSLSGKDTDLSRFFYKAVQGDLNLLHLEEPALQEVITLAAQIEKELSHNHFAGHLLAGALLTQLLILLNRYADNPTTPAYTSLMPPLVAQAFAYIEQHLTEDLSLSTLAAKLYHNSDYLSRRFKAVTGTSIQQFILAKRVTLAQRLLREGITPSEVCFSAGFHNYSNFSRTFTKQIGMSPKQYQLREHSNLKS